MSISPSLSPRQCPDHYAFLAGRNLLDKEFHYLRTVIVTAAVHRGFGHRLPCHQVKELSSCLVVQKSEGSLSLVNQKPSSTKAARSVLVSPKRRKVKSVVYRTEYMDRTL
ncbi:hypothetical protein KY285_007813 [Solanum tuberosum]|nr:hypothetical protein KY285_007813 [Solanum tuberosum]